jgi:hypothetical protein
MVELFDVRRSNSSDMKDKFTLPDQIAEGGSADGEGRNVLLFKEAAALRNRGYEFDEMFTALRALNYRRCVPPLSEGEVEHIARSAAKYEPTHEIGTGDDYKLARLGVGGEIENTFGYKFHEFLNVEFPPVEWVIHGLNNGELGQLVAVPNAGKAQPLTAKIKTFDGWKSMGDIQVGDSLASIDGLPSFVAGVFPQGVRPVYKVTFSDGRSTEVSDEHLWQIHSSSSFDRKWGKEGKVVTTTQLKVMFEDALERDYEIPRLYIPTISGIFGNDAELPIDPYMLGALIGDANLTRQSGVRFSSPDDAIVNRLNATVASEGDGYRLKRVSEFDYHISRPKKGAERNSSGNMTPNIFQTKLERLGLMGKKSESKFIPPQYMAASKNQRLELLRGLIDTDGTVGKNRSVSYSTSSKQLALDVQKLVRSLGGISKIGIKEPIYTYKGEKRIGQTNYIVHIRHTHSEEFLTLPKKRDRLLDRSTTRQKHLRVVSVEYVRDDVVQCIAVTHPSKLYVTDDYIVTHNTTLCLGMGMCMAAGIEYLPLFLGGRPRRVMYLDFENRGGFLQQDVRAMSRNFSDSERALIDENLFIVVDQEIYKQEMNLSNPDHLDIVTREAIAHKADLIIIDTMAAGFSLSNENDNSEMERVVIKPLKHLARQTGAAILVVHHKGKANETGDHSKLYAGRGASSLAAAVRLVLTLDHLKDGSGKRIDNHIVLSQPKIKGVPFPDTTFKLDFARRWFEPADIQIADDTSSYEVVWSAVDRPMKRKEIIEAAKAAFDAKEQVAPSEKTIDRIIKLGVATGRLKPGSVQGQYEPAPVEEVTPVPEVDGEVIVEEDNHEGDAIPLGELEGEEAIG